MPWHVIGTRTVWYGLRKDLCLGEKLWLDLLPQGSGHRSGRIHSLQAARFSTILYNVQ
jgi:hypothetical protein